MLNSDKTEVMLVGSQNQLKGNVGLHELDPCSLSSKLKLEIKSLGVILDPDLSLETHIREVTKVSFYHLRNIAKLRPITILL